MKRTIFITLFSSLCFLLEAQAQPPEESLRYAEGLSAAFQHIAEVVTPSVVTIKSLTKAKPQRRGQMMRDPFFDQFREFFGDEIPFGAPMQPRGGQVQQGLGTGVIIDDKGHILTNNHVVGDADEITVQFPNEPGSRIKAEVIGKDPASDLAVIKLKNTSHKFVPAKLGDSDKLKIGEWVVAVGNPFGLNNSITAGIVSAKGRSIATGATYEDFIQTDAAINPGNSGGPLVNIYGEVIGINTAIFSKSGGYQGIGFAIPSNMARSVMDSLVAHGKVVRGWLGVAIQNLDENLAQSFNYPSTEGALVGSVQPGTPASNGGMKQGDIVVSYNGEKITSVTQLRNLVAATVPGKEIPVEVVRDGRKQTLQIKIAELKGEDQEAKQSADEQANDIGIRVQTLTPELRARLNTKQTQGVIVTSIEPGSLAENYGIQPSDIITSVNGKPIEDAAAFAKAIGKSELKKGVRLVVESDGMERFVLLKTGD